MFFSLIIYSYGNRIDTIYLTFMSNNFTLHLLRIRLRFRLRLRLKSSVREKILVMEEKDVNIKQKIQQNLLEWFAKNKRDLPWRKTKDGYKIWVSEIMLQQTRVDTVIEYYNRFIDRFPTVKELAQAEEQEVLKYWQGLGYYSRARNLYKGAKMVWEKYGGILPDNMEQIKKIPGIGPYTAGAILSIAYNLPYPAVDGNVLRVFSRILDIKEDIAQPGTVRYIQDKVKEYIPSGYASEFTESLMELGALICTPISPLCLVCPLYHQCAARQKGIQEKLPIKSKKVKPKRMHMVFCVIRSEEKILLIKNASNGLVGGMWGFMEKEGHPSQDDQTLKLMLDDLNIPVQHVQKLGTVRHIFTHMDWDMHLYMCEALYQGHIGQEHEWVGKEEIENYPLPKVYQKIWEKIEW